MFSINNNNSYARSLENSQNSTNIRKSVDPLENDQNSSAKKICRKDSKIEGIVTLNQDVMGEIFSYITDPRDQYNIVISSKWLNKIGLNFFSNSIYTIGHIYQAVLNNKIETINHLLSGLSNEGQWINLLTLLVPNYKKKKLKVIVTLSPKIKSIVLNPKFDLKTDNYNFLLFAIKSQSEEVVDRFIKEVNQGQLDFSSEMGKTILLEICLNFKDDVVRKVVNSCKHKLEQKDWIMVFKQFMRRDSYNRIANMQALLNQFDANYFTNKEGSIFKQACMINKREILNLLMTHPKFKIAKTTYQQGFEIACTHGKAEIAEDLLRNEKLKRLINPSCEDNKILKTVVAKEKCFKDEKLRNRIIKLLISDVRVDASIDNNAAFRWAVKTLDTEILKQLFDDPEVDPSVEDNIALKMAIKNDLPEIFSSLIRDKKVDPSIDNNLALRHALLHKRKKDIEFLMEHPKVKPFVNNNFIIQMLINHDWSDVYDAFLQGWHSERDTLTFEDHSLLIDLFPNLSDDVDATISHILKVAFIFDRAEVLINHFTLVGFNQMVTEEKMKDDLKAAIKHDLPEIFSSLIRDKKVDPSIDNNLALRHALLHNRKEDIEFLMEHPKVKPFVNNNFIIYTLISYGRSEMISALLVGLTSQMNTPDVEELHKIIFNKLIESEQELISFILKAFDSNKIDEIIKESNLSPNKLINILNKSTLAGILST